MSIGRWWLAALLAVSPAVAVAAPPDAIVDRLAVTLDISADASLTVRETITLRLGGSHDTFVRTMSTRGHRRGLDRDLRFEAIGVFDDAFRPLRSEVSYQSGRVSVTTRIPEAGAVAKTVMIAYRLRRAVFDVGDGQQLDWDITGADWPLPIRHVEAIVSSPPGVSLDRVRAELSTERGVRHTEERAGTFITFRTIGSLRPGQPLPLTVRWPAGTFKRVERAQALHWRLTDHWPLVLPLLTVILAMTVWWRYGRDPVANRSIKPEYAPPADLSPAEAGTLLDERVEPRDVIATLVDLAVRGYLEIERVRRADDEPDFLFRRLKPVMGDPSIRPFELYVLAKIFDSDWTLNMRLLSEARREYDNVFPPIREEIYRTMVANRLFPASPGRIRAIWLIGGLTLVAIAGQLYLQPPAWMRMPTTSLAIAVALSGALITTVSRLMPRKSLRGVQALARVRGFQEFLERAEKDRLERLPPDALHQWLPWAIALGVTERWIFNWDGVVVDKPAWFTGHDEFSLATYHQEVRTFGRCTEDALLTTRRGGGAVS